MCKFCEESAFTIIIEHEYDVYADNYFGNVHIHEEPYEQDNSVVFEMRCGSGCYRDWETDRKSTRLNSSHSAKSRMPSSA